MESSRRDLTVLGALAALIALGFVAGALIRSGGHPMFPLDDAFIHLQTAEQTSQLRFYHFFDGQGFTPAASGPLWVVLLVPAFWIGLEGIRVILWVWALEGLIWLASVALVYRIGTTASGRGAGIVAALLFLAHGHMAWSHFNGMETGLYALEMLLAIHGVQRWAAAAESGEGAHRWAWVAWLATASLGLTRPEGLGLALAAGGVVVWRACRGLTGPVQALGWLLAAAPAALWMLVSRALSGSWGPNALASKGIFADPYWTLSEELRAAAQNWSDFWLRLMEGDGTVNWLLREGAVPWVGPLVLIFAVLGAGPGLLGLVQRRRGEGILLAGLWFVLGVGAACTSAVAFSHHGRYFAPYSPLLMVLAAVGASEIAGLWRNRGPHVLTALAAPLVLLAAPSVLWWGQTYADNCQDIYEQHRRLTWWLNDRSHVPAGTRVGLVDVGAITYYSEGLELSDVVGLGTTRLAPDLPRQAIVARNGLASIWENFERFEGRPEIVISYPNLWEVPHQPEMWLGEPIFAAASAHPSITSGQLLTAYRLDWSGVGSGNEPGEAALRPDGLAPGETTLGVRATVVDRVDVADLVSEAEHGYTWHHADERPHHRYHLWPPRFNTLRWQRRDGESASDVIWDGGRRMSGGEAFTVRVDPDRRARLVARSDGEAPAELRIRVDGGPWHELAVERAEGWVEVMVDIPSGELTATTARVEVAYEWRHTGESYWHSYHWWIVQVL